MLSQHPEIYLASAKDIYYFDRYYARGMTWYESHFNGAERYKAIGEFSHDYLFSEAARERIKADLPEVKLISLLRNPVERAFSEFLFIRKHRLVEKSVTFREAVIKFPSIIEGGMYGMYLGRYLRKFGTDAMFIGDFIDISTRPVQLLEQLCNFLNVNSKFKFKHVHREALSASMARIGLVALVAKLMAMKLRDLGFSNVVGRIKDSSIIHKALYRPYNDGEKPSLTTEDRRWLYEIYQPDIQILEKLLARSFEDWTDG